MTVALLHLNLTCMYPVLILFEDYKAVTLFLIEMQSPLAKFDKWFCWQFDLHLWWTYWECTFSSLLLFAIHEHGVPLHLFRSYFIPLHKVLYFILCRSFPFLIYFWVVKISSGNLQFGFNVHQMIIFSTLILFLHLTAYLLPLTALYFILWIFMTVLMNGQ